MRELIVKKLKEIERQENVRILYAVESGSRAWGFPSPDSDYDVRFLYVRPLEYYLKLEKTRDVIELPINEVLDINGWDLSKALRLLHGANPTLFEWMASPIVYHQTDFVEPFRSFAAQYFSAKKEIYHYISTAESTYRDFLMADMVKLKKYFYVLRPILACRWILEMQTQPPMLFHQLAESQLPRELQGIVSHLLDLKMNTPEIKRIPRIPELSRYLEESIAEIKQIAQQLPTEETPGWRPLEQLFYDIVMQETECIQEESSDFI